MNYQGAIFDMDGLLFDTERVFQETWKELAEEIGVELGESFAREICGTSGAHMCRVLEAHYHVPDGRILRNRCMEAVRKKLEREVPVKKGAPEILEFFRANGVRLAVASSSLKEQIRANLAVSGLDVYFDEIVSGTEVKNGKPAPDIFRYAAQKIGCAPEDCCIFEDSENGIRSGYAAGCDAIMIPDLIQPSSEVRACCSGIYSDLLEAMEALKRLG